MFSNKFSIPNDSTNIDFSLGFDIHKLPNNFGTDFDLIIGAPPCGQFTKANTQHWKELPIEEINTFLKCFLICLKSGKPWILENPPGRILKFIPELKPYKKITLSDTKTNKEWVLYSNLTLIRPNHKRYGKKSINNFGKIKRNEYPKYFYQYIETMLKLNNIYPFQESNTVQPPFESLYLELKRQLEEII